MYLTSEYNLKHNHSSPSSPSSLRAADENLKQKKRLSFREPEVETPHSSNWSNTNRIQLKPSSVLLETNVGGSKHSASLEDLTLEDQTFIIARHVGQAFDRKPCERRQLNSATTSKSSCPDYRYVRRNSGLPTGTLQNDCSHVLSSAQNNVSNSCCLLDSKDDARYFEALSPPILNMSTMKFLATKNKVTKSSQTLVAATDMVSTSVEHQMQVLKFQMEQQRQQTQAALTHVQLLKDQLQAETSARCKAQTQNHELMTQNKELLDHIQNLFRQIQDLEKLLEQHKQKTTFPSSSFSSSNSSLHKSQKTQVKEVTTTSAVVMQKNNNNEAKSTKTNNAFAPNSVMANRRSSLTGIKPFQSRTTYLETNDKSEEVKLRNRSLSPAPENRMRTIGLTAHSNKANNSHDGISLLFNGTQKHKINGTGSTKGQQEDVKVNATKEWKTATKNSENLPLSSISVPNFTPKNTTQANTKPLINNKSKIHGELLAISKNPLTIRENYTSRKCHSSDLLLSDCTSENLSSVSLSPKPRAKWSKFTKFHNSDSVLPLAFDDTTSLSITENKRFPSGTSMSFNS